jgi:hypothetical protein
VFRRHGPPNLRGDALKGLGFKEGVTLCAAVKYSRLRGAALPVYQKQKLFGSMFYNDAAPTALQPRAASSRPVRGDISVEPKAK